MANVEADLDSLDVSSMKNSKTMEKKTMKRRRRGDGHEMSRSSKDVAKSSSQREARNRKFKTNETQLANVAIDSLEFSSPKTLDTASGVPVAS